ncbi:hypothetical protein C362_01943 [Cryptococcus neoformans Bt1]|nr:hypothetical protein C362_01943 [Cryptococcus neoformans var. grubii Bt1]OXG29791.1 hypothetical protein C367_02247 [Cryptococcus neoformans var. grubii Ze90-1]
MDRQNSTAMQKPARPFRKPNPTMPLFSSKPQPSRRTVPEDQTLVAPPPADPKLKIFDERWDVYFHAFLLHQTKHSDCYYYNGQWWFPENRRNENTLHMFVAARWAPLDNLKVSYCSSHCPRTNAHYNYWQYYNLHLVCSQPPFNHC